jgi:hypothetical protein
MPDWAAAAMINGQAGYGHDITDVDGDRKTVKQCHAPKLIIQPRPSARVTPSSLMAIVKSRARCTTPDISIQRLRLRRMRLFYSVPHLSTMSKIGYHNRSQLNTVQGGETKATSS